MDPKHDQTTNEASPSRARNSKGGEPNPQAEMKFHKAEEDVLGAIENVEAQLSSLRKAHEDHRRAMAELANRKREIEQLAGELEGRESELTGREVELAEMRQDFESRELNLVQRASGLEQRESKLDAQAEEIQKQEADLAAKIKELDAQLEGISQRKAELDAAEREVKQKLDREDKAASELHAVKEQIAELEGQISTLGNELKAAQSKLRGREIELGERSRALEELAEKAGSFEHDLKQVSDRLEREQKVTEGLRAQIEKLELDRDSDGALAERVSQLEAQLEHANAELEQSRSQIESLTGAAAAHDQKNDERVAELTKALEESRAQIDQLNAQLGEIAGTADEELTGERERVNKLEEAIEQLHQQLKQSQQERDELSEKLKATDAQPQSDPKELAELRDQLETAQKDAASAQQQLQEREKALESLRKQIESGGGEAAQAQAKVQELEAQSSELFKTIEDLSAQLEEAKKAASAAPKAGDGGAVSDEWTERRRDRLGRMRRLLKADAEKIRMATEALRTRYEQCEQVLTKRAELAEAYEAIAAAQRKYHGREVRSGVVLGLMGMMAIALLLAASSWFVSGRIAPGQYAAKTTLAAASSGERRLSEADLAEWEVYITELTSDPRFLEVAAERMKRRGIGELGIPGDLAKEMQNSLDVTSAMPGTVVLEYRAPGAGRAERVLDTFAVAISSAANNARARRSDAPTTLIEEAAASGEEPLDTARLEMAGMIFGGGLLATLILGGILWGRLSAAKARFEKDSRVEPLFDEEQWQLPAS